MYNARMRGRRVLPEILLLLLTALVSSAFAQDSTPAPASVSGVVMNAGTNQPYAGVLITMSGGGVTTTDDSGAFVLKDVFLLGAALLSAAEAFAASRPARAAS